MTTPAVEYGLWSTAVLVVVATVMTTRESSHSREAQAPVIWMLPHEVGLPETDSLFAAADRVTRSDPFRLDRRPAEVAFGAATGTTEPARSEPSTTRPSLSLSGIVGGPPWVALLDGVPGRDGSTVLHAGDSIGGLKARAITATSATISGFDTTWKLTVKRPWP